MPDKFDDFGKEREFDEGEFEEGFEEPESTDDFGEHEKDEFEDFGEETVPPPEPAPAASAPSGGEFEGFGGPGPEAAAPAPSDEEFEGFEAPAAAAMGAAAAGGVAGGGAGFGAGGPIRDEYTEVTDVQEPGFGSKLAGSCFGIAIGFVLFFASFYILYLGETAVDQSKFVDQAAAIQAAAPDAGAEGKLVKFSGTAKTTRPVADEKYVPGRKFLYLERKAEMYAWVEKTETKTIRVRGKKKRKTTYRYEKAWTSSPKASSSFKHPRGHENPPMKVESQTQKAPEVTVGNLTVHFKRARVMGAEEIAPPKPKAAPVVFNPDDPKGSGAVEFAGMPAVTEPAVNKYAKGKKFLFTRMVMYTCQADGTWKATATREAKAKGARVGKVILDLSAARFEAVPVAAGPLYKPKTAATAPKAGNKKLVVYGIEIGKGTTFKGDFSAGTLKARTVYGFGKEKLAAKADVWFLGKGTRTDPKVGDIRLSFTAIPLDSNLFILGELQGTKINPWSYGEGDTFMIAAALSEAEVKSRLKTEYKLKKWLGRIGGFLAMWIGMCLMVGPLTTLLSFIPAIGRAIGSLIFAIFFIIALVLTAITILLIKLFWVLVAVLFILIVVGVVMKLKGGTKTAPAG
jgi:hypothetical protein